MLLPLAPISAQAIGQGFELERAGRYDQAASVYFATLRAEPANVSALLGLERVLPPLNRLAELLPAVRRATVASPTNVALRGILLRTYVALNEPDSARAVALRWAAASPRDEAPYREWAIALEDAHRHADARAVLLAGRQALGRPGVYGIELAELSRLTGDWEGAAREWAAALPDAPAQLTNAASELGEAPEAERERITRVLTAAGPTGERAILTGRLAAEPLRRDGARARGGAGMGRCRARVRRSRRPRGRARRARACGPGFERASRRAAARAERRGRGPDRRGTARRGGPPARE
ncbi:MAG: hypothetical protein DMD61_02970 [Gemmatimonadetes bacterium]|nr:MAG: hypothetical protein DMD61_02970 [Gemmatimonadota bacterium]